ncbi:2Fe-2S iron-sulfur cluster-binding protein [Paenibacillus donghaensis]|uniref:2Fe-2S iron-sulfur cluster-binding protein n=1 Tax=Paenibacillus donghaensis TaxID=414771 RepID=UPI002AD21089|nr:2Fe-2S iron-sulfur cluster-binding protein [Paenibacillus donghaensis]
MINRFRQLFDRKKPVEETKAADPKKAVDHAGTPVATMQLTGRTIEKTVVPEPGKTILQHAKDHEVDWQHMCKRGTCARCRCQVIEGYEFLEEPTEAEYRRLDPEEFDEGFRLGCQAVVKAPGKIVARNKTYF